MIRDGLQTFRRRIADKIQRFRSREFAAASLEVIVRFAAISGYTPCEQNDDGLRTKQRRPADKTATGCGQCP